MTTVTPYRINAYIPISMLTLNIKGLNSPIKSYRLAEWKETEDPSIFSFEGTHVSLKNTHRLKVQVWEKLFHAKETKRNQGSCAYTSDKIDVKPKTIVRHSTGHYKIKGLHCAVFVIM